MLLHDCGWLTINGEVVGFLSHNHLTMVETHYLTIDRDSPTHFVQRIHGIVGLFRVLLGLATQ